MTVYTVDSEAVLSTTATARASMARIQSEVGGLHHHLTALQSSWTGQAASGFQALVAEWRATQLRVEENLEALGAALGHAGQQYQDIEVSNARLFAR